MNLFSLTRSQPAAKAEPQTAALDKPDLNALLLAMQKYGRPVLGIYGADGLWHCGVEMHVAALGVRFECKSSHECKTPLEAVNECNARIQEALKMIAGGTP